MRLDGGHSVMLQGRPSGSVADLPEPEVLYLPRCSRRFVFSDTCVGEGERVRTGQALARDPRNFGLPLLAPRGGTVRLDPAGHHIVLEDVVTEHDEAYRPEGGPRPAPQGASSAAAKRLELLTLGAWQFFCDAHTGALPDPRTTAGALIVSTLALEPFAARGDVQLRENMLSFASGLAHMRAVAFGREEDQPNERRPAYVALPDAESDLARQVQELIRGYAWLETVKVPLRYPFDSPALLARALGLKQERETPVWALRTEGVLAVDRALTLSRPCVDRIVSVGGPAVGAPTHLRTVPGYPLADLVSSGVVRSTSWTRPGRVARPPVRAPVRTTQRCDLRALDGGVFTGRVIAREQLGLDSECSGLTVLPEHTEREFMGFLRPGWERGSYSRCFLSTVRRPSPARLTTALNGAGRACVSCGSCEEVCPAGIMPQLIHKYLYQDGLEEAERAGADLCVGCGLCSYVCPSKIELCRQLLDAKERIRAELRPEEPVSAGPPQRVPSSAGEGREHFGAEHRQPS